MTSKLRRFLSKFSGFNARIATYDDIADCVDMTVAYMVESGKLEDTDYAVFERTAEHIAEVIDNGTVLVVGKSPLRGMVCCKVTAPDIWDGKTPCICWLLYVRPEYRGKPNVVNALIRGAAELGADKLRFAADTSDAPLVEAYMSALGATKEIHHLGFVLPIGG